MIINAIYKPIGNYYLGDFIASNDEFFAILAVPAPGSGEKRSKYVVYDRNQLVISGTDKFVYANGIGPDFAHDVYD